ncbi:unnamed protein product [Nippostrongylus brasiliensis]|uniref:Uncharacterized protein n=1 Tax=Nippostrongylus brasiliensis TaxID=27835 RepID=A0A0N4YBV3_NIPBR|nr:unnamed protein product [Nippostrongylus brasiliensis]
MIFMRRSLERFTSEMESRNRNMHTAFSKSSLSRRQKLPVIMAVARGFHSENFLIGPNRVDFSEYLSTKESIITESYLISDNFLNTSSRDIQVRSNLVEADMVVPPYPILDGFEDSSNPPVGRHPSGHFLVSKSVDSNLGPSFGDRRLGV